MGSLTGPGGDNARISRRARDGERVSINTGPNLRTYLGIDDLLCHFGYSSDDPLPGPHLFRNDAACAQEMMRKADIESGPDGDG